MHVFVVCVELQGIGSHDVCVYCLARGNVIVTVVLG